MFSGQFESLACITRFTDHPIPMIALYDGFNTFPEKGMIIND
jgi:hypothetical protein